MTHGRNRMKRTALFVFLLVGAVLVYALSSVGVAWATPSQDALRQGTVPPVATGEKSTLVEQDKTTTVPVAEASATITIKPGSVKLDGKAAEVQIVTTVKPAALVPPKPAEPTITFLGRAIEINVFDGVGKNATGKVFFNPPLEIVFDINEAEWTAAGGDLSKFNIRYYNAATAEWVILPTIVDPVPTGTPPVRKAKASVTHLTIFGLFLQQPTPGPGTPTPTISPAVTPTKPPIPGGDASVGTEGLVLLGLLGLFLVGSGAYYLRMGRRQSS